MSRNTFIESVESRLFLSATPVLDGPVKLDRLVLAVELAKFKLNIAGGSLRLAIDSQRIKNNVATGDTSLVAPFATLKADEKAMHTTLQEERLTQGAQALIDQAAIKLDYAQILKDKGNDTALATDHAKLLTDRMTLQNDLVTGLDARIATRQSAEITISADTAAILTAVDADSAASAKLLLAVDKFSADRITVLDKLTDDLQSIAATRTKLVADLTAEQGT